MRGDRRRIGTLPHRVIGLICAVTAMHSRAVNAQMVVAGQESGPRIIVIDVTNPAVPVVRGSVLTILTGISSVAIAANGSVAIAGELNGCHVARIDISNPDAPVVTGTICLSFIGVSGVAVSGTRAAARKAGWWWGLQ